MGTPCNYLRRKKKTIFVQKQHSYECHVTLSRMFRDCHTKEISYIPHVPGNVVRLSHKRLAIIPKMHSLLNFVQSNSLAYKLYSKT